MESSLVNPSPLPKIGFGVSIFLSIFTLFTFGLAVTAIPNSGAFCENNCFDYPYLDTLSEYPRDYYWMFAAVMLMLIYLLFVLVMRNTASGERQIFGQISYAFAIMATIVLICCYFIQITVVPISLKSGETDGIILLTQYNPHGIFIALEELGYLLMGIGFFFLAISMNKTSLLEKSIRWIYLIAATIVVISFLAFTFAYGDSRLDRFEVVSISVDWLVLIINGGLTAVYFYRMKGSNQ